MARLDSDVTYALNVGKHIQSEEQSNADGEKNPQAGKEIKQPKQSSSDSWIKKNLELITPFVKKYHLLILLTICILAAVLVRMHMASLPLMEVWATQSAEANVRSQVTQEITTQYALLSDQKKTDLINAGVKERMNSLEIQSYIKTKAQNLAESYKNENNDTYFYETDAYYFYDLAKKDPWKSEKPVFPLLEAGYGNILSKTDPSLSFEGALFTLPIVLVILALIPIFFIARMIAGPLAGFAAAFLFAIHPEFLAYSLAGLNDTNTLNIFFTVFGAWTFLELCRQKTALRKGMFAGLLALTLVGFYYTWSGYYSILGVLFATAFAFYLLRYYRLFLTKYHIKNPLLLTTAGSVMLAVILFFTAPLLITYLPYGVQAKLKLQETAWPSTYATIAELQGVSLSEFIYRTGGMVLFLVALGSICYLAYHSLYREENEKTMSVLLILIALLIYGFSAHRAIRFLPFFIVFYCILAGSGLVLFLRKSVQEMNHAFGFETILLKVVAGFILIILLLIPVALPMVDNFEKTERIKPIMDDALAQSAAYLKENSAQDAQLFVWWDKGHFYQTLAERKTLQSAVPSMPRTYWMSRVLTETDEEKAAGILQMLACGTEQQVYTNALSAVGYQTVLSHIDQELQNMTFCNASELYVVVTDDMMTRFDSVQHITAWNPLVSDAKILVQGMTPAQAQQKIAEYYQVSAYRASEIYAKTQTRGESSDLPIMQYACSFSKTGGMCFIDRYAFKIDLETMNASFQDYHPLRFVYVSTEGNVSEVSYEGKTIPYVLIVYERAENTHAVLVSPELAESMYVRLLITKGSSLSYFEEVYRSEHVATKKVVVYRFNPT